MTVSTPMWFFFSTCQILYGNYMCKRSISITDLFPFRPSFFSTLMHSLRHNLSMVNFINSKMSSEFFRQIIENSSSQAILTSTRSPTSTSATASRSRSQSLARSRSRSSGSRTPSATPRCRPRWSSSRRRRRRPLTRQTPGRTQILRCRNSIIWTSQQQVGAPTSSIY